MAQKHLRDVERALKRVERAQERLRDAIVAASESGETLRDIGERAQLSPQRVHQIIRAHGGG
jgi:DNA-directed RNA polymerase sigma subunit (sigma70/sigma32)